MVWALGVMFTDEHGLGLFGANLQTSFPAEVGDIDGSFLEVFNAAVKSSDVTDIISEFTSVITRNLHTFAKTFLVYKYYAKKKIGVLPDNYYL